MDSREDNIKLGTSKKWTKREKALLLELYQQGLTLGEMRQILGRTNRAIYHKLSNMGLSIKAQPNRQRSKTLSYKKKPVIVDGVLYPSAIKAAGVIYCSPSTVRKYANGVLECRDHDVSWAEDSDNVEAHDQT